MPDEFTGPPSLSARDVIRKGDLLIPLWDTLNLKESQTILKAVGMKYY